jgi:1-acyl-sn-glycerol-3-phosphate acyltransferase
LLYGFLKVLVRLAMVIFCRKIIINRPGVLRQNGPVLLACNHPNSFLDAAILADLFRQPIFSLARGDVFQKPFYIRLLTSLHILPIYRNSEGVKNLGMNYQTFDVCRSIFRKNGIVLIFSEAMCINEWHLRPLKKGTARLAFQSWAEGIPLEVIPVGINYSSFRRFGKNLFINFGNPMRPSDFNMGDPEGLRNQAFNDRLRDELGKAVFDISDGDRSRQQQVLEVPISRTERILLAAPGVVGWVLHAPLYLPLKIFTHKKTWNNDHYDAVLTSLLIFLYPCYLALLVLAVALMGLSWWALLLVPISFFTAWAWTRIKAQLDKVQQPAVAPV